MRTLLAAISIAFIVSGTGCPRVAPTIPESRAGFGGTIMLSIGKSLTFEDGLHVTLVEISDSRCPEGVVCIWQGELSPVVGLSGGTLPADATLTLGTVRAKAASTGNYAITLVAATETTATLSVAVAK